MRSQDTISFVFATTDEKNAVVYVNQKGFNISLRDLCGHFKGLIIDLTSIGTTHIGRLLG